MKEIPAQLMQLLSDGNYHSGETVGEAMGVSRAAVWKKLKGLESLGVKVNSVKGRGYCLAQPVSLFDEVKLQKISQVNNLPPVICHSVIDSTNTRLLEFIRQADSSHGQIVVAEQQTSGRGRRGKTWVSPYAANLYFSLAWDFEQGAAKLDGLSLVVGLALQESIEDFSGINAQVKWPNDLLVEGKKIAGILLEITGDPTALCHVVIGVGVNLNMLDGAGKIDQPWQSLALLSGAVIDKTDFMAVFVNKLLSHLQRFSQTGFSSFTRHWDAVDALKGAELMLSQGNNVTLGEYAGVTDKGELQIKTALGVEVFNGGEVSVRRKV